MTQRADHTASSRDPLNARSLPGFVWKARQHFRPAIILRLASVVAVAPLPLLLQRVVDAAAEGGNVRTIILFAGIFLGLVGVHILTCLWSNRLLGRALPRLVKQLRSRIFNKLQFLHFGFLDRTHAGKLISKYAFDSQKIELALSPLLHQVLPSLVLALMMTGVLLFLNVALTVVVLCVAPAVALMRYIYLEKLTDTNHRTRMAQEGMSGRANEYISALKLVRSFGMEQKAVDHVDEESERYREARARQMVVQQDLGVFGFSMQQSITILVIAVGAVFVLRGSLSVGALFAFSGSMHVILSPIQLLTQFSQQYFLARESYLSIRELVDAPYEESWTGTRQLEDLRGAISYDHVSFAYESGEAPAVKEISLEIPAGADVAFVGPSGSGKSTLVNLLLGLYRAQRGCIRIDGVSQDELDLRDLRRRCAIVSQDNLLLSGSLRENIAFGRPEADGAAIREAARQANALDFIEALPDGFDSAVGERGVALSGGQRQRIAIARAILRDPRILILDEATSALDYESERLIQEALDYLAKGRTVITIAHRLSTIMGVDEVFVLEAGRLVEGGSPQKLREAEGSAFRRLVGAGAGL